LSELPEEPNAQALAAAFRAIVLRDPATTLKQQIARLVVAGVESGLVSEDPFTGLAVANTTLPIPSSEVFPSTLEQLQQTKPFFEEYRTVEDLRFALSGGYAQEVALHALGIPRPPVGALNAVIAIGLSTPIALVAQGVAPAKVLEFVRDVLERRHGELTGLKTAQWSTALENIFKTGLHLHIYDELTPAQSVLTSLSAFVIDLPSAFSDPKSAHVTKADKFLRGLRVTGLKPEFQPRQARKGPSDSPWGAAVKFAGCFGQRVPPNRRDAQKSRKI
jgi:hypothetical protein